MDSSEITPSNNNNSFEKLLSLQNLLKKESLKRQLCKFISLINSKIIIITYILLIKNNSL